MQTIKHILVSTDFSPSSSSALELAISLATQFDAELTLLHVWDLPVYPYMELTVGTADVTASIEQAATECLATKLKEVQARLPRAKSLLKMGLPWQQIVEATQETKADLLVMGTHGRRGLDHALMGSVAEKLVRLSPIPVLTVRAAPKASS
jgi:nucleotide-binding universal stress UspA family protein